MGKEQSVKNKIEKWLSECPEEVKITKPLEVERLEVNINIIGKLTPELITNGYSIRFDGWVAKWE